MSIVYVQQTDTRTKIVYGDTLVTSLDGEFRSPLESILNPNWPEGYLDIFGIHLVDITPIDGKEWTGQLDGSVTPPVAVFRDGPTQLEMYRQEMYCSPLQGKLALGEARWSIVEDMLVDPETPFAMRVAITSAVQWDRSSQMMDELAWIMQLTAEQVDDLFELAMSLQV